MDEGEGEEMVYTLKEAEPLLELKRARLMQLIAQGALHAEQTWTKKGPRRVIRQSEIDRFLRERAKDIAARTGPGVRPKLPRRLRQDGEPEAGEG